MKVYKVSEEEYKKQKTTHIISGVLCIIVATISAYLFFMDYSDNISSTVVFGAVGITLFKAISNIDRFHFELNGTVLTSYLKDKVYSQSDLSNAEIEIKEKRKNSKIYVFENDRATAIYRSSDIGINAFNELLKDISAIKK